MLVYGKSHLAFMPLSRNRSNRRRSIGTYNWDPVVEIEYPEAFQEALLKVLDVKKAFRYIYLGGAFTEPDQEKTLWFFVLPPLLLCACISNFWMILLSWGRPQLEMIGILRRL